MVHTVCIWLDDQVKYNQMSASTGEVTLDIMDQSFSGELAAPPSNVATNNTDSSFGSLIKKKGRTVKCYRDKNKNFQLK